MFIYMNLFVEPIGASTFALCAMWVLRYRVHKVIKKRRIANVRS